MEDGFSLLELGEAKVTEQVLNRLVVIVLRLLLEKSIRLEIILQQVDVSLRAVPRF